MIAVAMERSAFEQDARSSRRRLKGENAVADAVAVHVVSFLPLVPNDTALIGLPVLAGHVLGRARRATQQRARRHHRTVKRSSEGGPG